MPGAASTRRSIATRAALSGAGSIGVVSSKMRSDGSPMAMSATMLLPLEWMNGLPEPASAAISAATAPPWSLDAALITASAARASAPSSSASSSVPTTGSIPCAVDRLALGAIAHEAAHEVAVGGENRRHRAADIAVRAGEEDAQSRCPETRSRGNRSVWAKPGRQSSSARLPPEFPGARGGPDAARVPFLENCGARGIIPPSAALSV